MTCGISHAVCRLRNIGIRHRMLFFGSLGKVWGCCRGEGGFEAGANSRCHANPSVSSVFFLIVKFYRYLQYCYLLQSLISRGRICAFISKKEQAKKEETRRKDGEITRIKYEFVLSPLLVRALAVSIER